MRLTPIVSALLMASLALGQAILLPPGPIAAGETFEVTLHNDTPDWLGVPGGNPLWLQHPDGGVIVPPNISDTSVPLPPGASVPLSFTVPAQGPGSNGSFVLRWSTAAVRLDVGTASTSFPAIHTNPWIFASHLTNPNYFGVEWEASNTGETTHAFGAADMLRVFSPGGTVPLMAASLAGVVLPPHRALTGTLTLAGVPVGPVTVEVIWTDPATNALTSVRHGVQEYAYNFVNVGLPGGHVIPAGDVLPVELFLQVYSDETPLYAFCVGFEPGTTPVRGVGTFPLVYDSAVAASFTDGIGGLLIANVGYATPAFAQILGLGWKASGIGITHPGVALSGTVVRCAAIGYEPGSAIFMISQAEDLLIQ